MGKGLKKGIQSQTKSGLAQEFVRRGEGKFTNENRGQQYAASTTRWAMESTGQSNFSALTMHLTFWVITEKFWGFLKENIKIQGYIEEFF